MSKAVPSPHQKLTNEILSYFRKLGVNHSALNEWWALGAGDVPYPRTINTLQKIKDNFPTKEEMTQWGTMPKTLATLQKIKYPTLVGWSVEEIVKAMKAYIYRHIRKYGTSRSEVRDCYQNGCIGIIHALRTDAGISAFAHHAFPRIRTSIRRDSATSGVITKPERRPSRTEVRRIITNWLVGRAYQQELDKLVAQKGAKKLSRLSKAKTTDVLKKLALIPLNKRKLVRKDDMIEYQVQKLGNKNYTELHIGENFKLSRLGADVLLDLFDYLNYKFDTHDNHQWVQLTKSVLLNRPDGERYQTVGDLINQVAESPDFHGNPISLNVEVEDGFSIHDTIEDENSPRPEELAHTNTTKRRARQFVSLIRGAMDLTPAQEAVLVHGFGLDDKKLLPGSEIATRIGELSGEDTKSVSRQRITQHQKAIFRKMVEVAYEVLLIDKATKTEMLSVMEKASLTPAERGILCAHHGLHGTPERDLTYLATNFERITGENVAIDLDKGGRAALVNQMMRDIKTKMVGAVI